MCESRHGSLGKACKLCKTPGPRGRCHLFCIQAMGTPLAIYFQASAISHERQDRCHPARLQRDRAQRDKSRKKTRCKSRSCRALGKNLVQIAKFLGTMEKSKNHWFSREKQRIWRANREKTWQIAPSSWWEGGVQRGPSQRSWRPRLMRSCSAPLQKWLLIHAGRATKQNLNGRGRPWLMRGHPENGDPLSGRALWFAFFRFAALSHMHRTPWAVLMAGCSSHLFQMQARRLAHIRRGLSMNLASAMQRALRCNRETLYLSLDPQWPDWSYNHGSTNNFSRVAWAIYVPSCRGNFSLSPMQTFETGIGPSKYRNCRWSTALINYEDEVNKSNLMECWQVLVSSKSIIVWPGKEGAQTRGRLSSH